MLIILTFSMVHISLFTEMTVLGKKKNIQSFEIPSYGGFKLKADLKSFC